MMRSSILGASLMLNVLIQHLPLQSLFWTKIWRAFRASETIKFNHFYQYMNEFEHAQRNLTLEYGIKKLGILFDFIGIELIYSSSGVFLSKKN